MLHAKSTDIDDDVISLFRNAAQCMNLAGVASVLSSLDRRMQEEEKRNGTITVHLGYMARSSLSRPYDCKDARQVKLTSLYIETLYIRNSFVGVWQACWPAKIILPNRSTPLILR
jgi:hypothetical protein